MPLELTPLDLAELTDGARKVLSGPAPLKLMAARGLAPLKPAELVAVLYQLGIGADPADAPVRAAAEKSITELPDKILAPALADPGLDPRVLDFFAPRLMLRPVLLETVILNRAVADATIVDLARVVGERELELIAVNEQSLLRAPAIIGALYMNPRARMSTVDRALELAVRNNVTVPGIPRWDDLVQAVLGQRSQPAKPPAEVDAVFAKVASVAVFEDTKLVDLLGDDLEIINEVESQKVEEAKKELPINELSTAQKIRLATLGNSYARAILIRDPIKMVAIAAINAPGMTDQEVVKFSANRSLDNDVIRVIANTREWLKIYRVKVNLVNNAKTPLPASMKLLPFLHDKDLRNVARSRSIPSALTSQAKKLMSQKGH